MLIKLGLILCILALIPIKSQSAVLSIDLGSEWLKVAVVNLKPGQIPISIAINECRSENPQIYSHFNLEFD